VEGLLEPAGLHPRGSVEESTEPGLDDCDRAGPQKICLRAAHGPNVGARTCSVKPAPSANTKVNARPGEPLRSPVLSPHSRCVVLREQQGAGQAHDGRLVGEDGDDVGAPLDLG
jgi:hypothetical protein